VITKVGELALDYEGRHPLTRPILVGSKTGRKRGRHHRLFRRHALSSEAQVAVVWQGMDTLRSELGVDILKDHVIQCGVKDVHIHT
jgi:hypothetical protein